jgi:hypothetical protein
LHNDKKMKKENLQHQQSIHRNIIKQWIQLWKKIFQKTTHFKHQNYQKKRRFKWTNVMDTTLHSMLIHNENDYFWKIIKSFQHLHSNLNLTTIKYYNNSNIQKKISNCEDWSHKNILANR